MQASRSGEDISNILPKMHLQNPLSLSKECSCPCSGNTVGYSIGATKDSRDCKRQVQWMQQWVCLSSLEGEGHSRFVP
jgi:hypothetical protein